MSDLKTGTLRAKRTKTIVGWCECRGNVLHICLQYIVRKEASHRASIRYRTPLFVRDARHAFNALRIVSPRIVCIRTVAGAALTKTPKISSMGYIRFSLTSFLPRLRTTKIEMVTIVSTSSHSRFARRARPTLPIKLKTRNLRCCAGTMRRFASAFWPLGY